MQNTKSEGVTRPHRFNKQEKVQLNQKIQHVKYKIQDSQHKCKYKFKYKLQNMTV